MNNYTYFKAIYYQYTHFARENIIESFNNEVEWNNYSFCKISKIGDLIKNMTLKIDIKINDPEYMNVDDKKILYDNDDYLHQFILKNEFKINEYINKIVTINNIKNDFKNILNDLNLIHMIEVFENFILQYSTSESTSQQLSTSESTSQQLSTSESTSQQLSTSESSISTSVEQKFSLDLDYINNTYSNEYIQENIEIKYTITNESFTFTAWDYFKLYHFMKYYETINDLNFLYLNSALNDEKNLLKKSKIEYFKKLEIFKLINKKKYLKWNPHFADNICKSIMLEVGGEKICEYCNLFYHFYTQFNKQFNNDIYQNMTYIEKDNVITVYIPILLQKNLFIPCIALKYNEIILNVKFNKLENLCQTDCKDIYISNVELYIDYIYLSEKERNFFCSEEIIGITSIQEKIIADIQNNDFTIVNLEFNKVSRQIIWFLYDFIENQYVEIDFNNFYEILIDNEMIGNKSLDNQYFNLIESWKCMDFVHNNKVYMQYNFSLFPYDYKPSGFIDFKRFKSKKLVYYNNTKIQKKKIVILSYGIQLYKISNGFLTLIM